MAWSKAQAREFVKEVKASVKDGWRFMVPEVRQAMICQKALSIVCGQDASTVKVEDVHALRNDMLREAGLE